MSADEVASEIRDTYDKVRDDRNAVSNSLSTQVRTTVISVLGLAWLLLGGTQEVLAKKFYCYSDTLFFLAGACVVVLLLDFSQGVFSIREIDKAIQSTEKALETNDPDLAGYKKEGDDVNRTISDFCFHAKLWGTVVVAVWLLAIMFKALSSCYKCVPP